jgi:hypothetical protein
MLKLLHGTFQQINALQLLLYNEERAQADALLKNGDSPSSIYGAEHLLRLFLKLPELLPLEGSTEEQYRLLQAKLHELLEFLEKKHSEFFLKTADYVTAAAPSTHAGLSTVAAANRTTQQDQGPQPMQH